MVEQTIGRWKRRFHLLHLEIRMRDPEDNCKVIAATAVLHNIAVDRNEREVDYIEPAQPQPDLEEYTGQINGHRARALLIHNRF